MKNRDCSIVRDLLPLYVDDIVSMDTKQFIEEHISECDDCKKELELSKRDITNEDITQIRNDDKEIIKKMKNNIRKKIVLAVCIALVVMIGAFSIAKVSQNVTQSNNEKNIVGVWENNGSAIISFDSSGTVTINDEHFYEVAGLVEGTAIYYFSFPDTVRIIQTKEDNECSVEFDVEIKDSSLTLYFMGEEYLNLNK